MSNVIMLMNPLICIKQILKFRDLLLQILIRNISSKYRGSILGLVWSFVHPLMMLSVYTFVFGIVFKARWGIEHFEDNRAAFPLIMFCGMAVYNIFSESVNTSTNVVINNPSYVKKVVFPLELLPICNVLTSCVFGMAWFILLLIGVVIFLDKVSWTILFLPITILPLFLLSSGISFFVASLGVYIRDTQQIVAVVTQILFFMTPIFYPASVVPERLQWIIHINPLSVIVEETRKIILYGIMPEFKSVFFILILSFVVFQLGFAWFAKTKKGFADVI